MADNLTYAVTVNSDGAINYPKDLITKNNIAQTTGATFTGDILLGDYTSESTTIQPNKIIVSRFPACDSDATGISSVDYFTEITGQSLSVCNGANKWFRSFVVDIDERYGNKLSLIGDRYSSSFGFEVKEHIVDAYGDGSVGIMKFYTGHSEDTSFSSLTISNGSLVNDTPTFDSFGLGIEFNNSESSFDGIVQSKIYGFTSSDLSSNTHKDKFVYTAAGVEEHINNCGFVKLAAPVYSDDAGRYTVGYSNITSSGSVQAFTRRSDTEGIRVLGSETYDCQMSIATIGAGQCPMNNRFYDNIDFDDDTNLYEDMQTFISVSSNSGAEIVIADNKIQLPVYNQDGTLAMNGNSYEYVAIKAVKNATTGMVSLVVMQ